MRSVVKNNSKQYLYFQKFSTNKWLGIMGVFCFLLYSNTIGNDYNLDDELVTIKHRLTSKGISAISEIFASPYYQDEFGYSYEYRPVTLAVFALEHQFFGDNPHVSHFFNVILFVLCSLLVFIFIRKLFPDSNSFFPVIATILFIIHPLHTEVVASIKNRDEILGLLGGLCSAYSLLKFIQSKNVLWFFGMVLFLISGILSKGSVISFVFVLPIIVLIKEKTDWKNYLIISTVSIFIIPWICFIKGFTLLNTTDIILIVTNFFGLTYLIFNFYKAVEFIRTSTKVFYRKANKIIDRVKNIHIPEIISLDENFFDKYSWYTLLCILIGTIGIFINHYIIFAYKPIWLFVCVCLVMFHPLILARYRLEILLMSALLLCILYNFEISNFPIEHLLAIFYVWVFKHLEKKNIRLLACLFILLSFSILLRLFNSGSGSYSIYDINSLVPLSFFFLIGYADAKDNKLLKKILLITLFLLIIISLIISWKEILENKFVLVELIVIPFALLWNGRQVIIEKITTISLILITILYFGIELFQDFSFPSNNQQITISESFINRHYSDSLLLVKSNSEFINTDRTLEFVEFPLEINKMNDQRLGTSLVVLGKYLKLMFFPWPISYYYGYNEVEIVSVFSTIAIFLLIIHLAIFFSGLYFINKHPVYFFGVFTYLSSIFLYSNIISPVSGMMGDRLTFVASLGFIIVVAYIISNLIFNLSGIKKTIFFLSFSAIVVIFSSLTIIRNSHWKNHLTLFEHDIKNVKNSAQAHNLLAKRLVLESFNKSSQKKQSKMREEALLHFQKAISIYPKFFNANYDLGRTYLLLNRELEAVNPFIKAGELQPSFFESWFQAGDILMRNNNKEEALKCYFAVLKEDSTNLIAYLSLGQIFFTQKEYNKAIEMNLKANYFNPNRYEPLNNLGIIYNSMGDKKNALVYFEKAYLINPNDRNLIVTMANIYKEFGEKDKADFLLQKAKQTNR